MRSIAELSDWFTARLSDYSYPLKTDSLRHPVEYIMALGGKRIRPAILLAAYDLFEDDLDVAFEAALAIELFHNFSLVHDDIMDEADIRRNQPATHMAFNTNDAILSGDAMLILSYRLLEKYEQQAHRIFPLFSKTALEVCEGQAMDMQFEKRNDVSIAEYIEMITLKTSVLIAAGMGMGAIIGGGSDRDVRHLYEFARNMGIAFQIQDDVLDTFGSGNRVGKRIGGDIVQRKKTYLYLKSLELLSESERSELQIIYEDTSEAMTDDARIERVKDLFNRAHVDVHARELMIVYHQLALSHLDAVNTDPQKKKSLVEFSEALMIRQG